MICAREGCEQPVPIKEPTESGFQRRYCSDNCRKRACDERNRKTCDCGATMGVRSRWSSQIDPNERCIACENARRTAGRIARVEELARLYNAGVSQKEIAAALGYSENSSPGILLREARRLGLIGYRNRGYGQAA